MTEPRACYQLTLPEQQNLAPRVLRALEQARAANVRITAAELAKQTGTNARKARAVIETLIERGETIAASNSDDPGYFIIQSAEEAEAYERTLRSRGIKILKRLACFRRGTQRRFGGQMPLQTLDAAIRELER